MKKVSSVIPIALAIFVTIGVGAWLKKRDMDAETGPLAKAPELRLELVRKGTGAIPVKDSPVPVPEAAAWIEYKMTLDGSLRLIDTLDFRGSDEDQKPWPVRSFKTNDATFAYIPAGNPVQPKRITITCLTGGTNLASWEAPPLSPPHKRKSSAKPLAKLPTDFPGLKMQPILATYTGSVYASVRPLLEVRPGKTELSAKFVDHTYGPIVENGQITSIPSVYLPKVDDLELEVQEAKRTTGEVTVAVGEGKVEAKNKVKFVEFAAPTEIDLGGGVSIRVTAVSQVGKCRLDLKLSGKDAATITMKSASSDGTPVRFLPAENGFNPQVEIVPKDLSAEKFAGFKLKLSFERVTPIRRERYLVKKKEMVERQIRRTARSASAL